MVNSAPSSDKVKKLAEYLDVSADCLLGISKVDTSEKAPTYDYLLKTFAKGKSNLTLEEKTKLVQMILSDKN
jgi:hypothetical protein